MTRVLVASLIALTASACAYRPSPDGSRSRSSICRPTCGSAAARRCQPDGLHDAGIRSCDAMHARGDGRPRAGPISTSRGGRPIGCSSAASPIAAAPAPSARARHSRQGLSSSPLTCLGAAIKDREPTPCPSSPPPPISPRRRAGQPRRLGRARPNLRRGAPRSPRADPPRRASGIWPAASCCRASG